MIYIDYDYYKSIYGDEAIRETAFNRNSWEACRKLDIETTGIDGVKKLKVAFPTDEDDAETVKRCACKLIEVQNRISEAENRISSSQGYMERSDGTLQGKVVSSVSAGNESISYSAKNSAESTLIDSVLADKKAQDNLFKDIITEYLSGITDSNGVNLLYMGIYPVRLEQNA